MEYGQTADNRIVYASGLKTVGFRSPRSVVPPTAHSGTFLGCWNASLFLSQLKKRCMQLGRYAKCEKKL